MARFVTHDHNETLQGNVHTITINNKAKYNCVGSQALEELTLAFQALATEEDLAAVIFTGAGDKAFIGGADLYEMETLTPVSARAFITKIHVLSQTIRALHVPVIARVNGVCFGAGMELAAICDIVVAEETATFAMPEVHVGIPSVVESAILPKILGTGLARDLVMTGRSLSGKEAFDAKLVQRLAPTGKLDETVQTVVDQILKGGRNAIRLQKQLCNDWEEESLSTSIELGIDAFSAAYETDEPAEMMGAFTNRKRS